MVRVRGLVRQYARIRQTSIAAIPRMWLRALLRISMRMHTNMFLCVRQHVGEYEHGGEHEHLGEHEHGFTLNPGKGKLKKSKQGEWCNINERAHILHSLHANTFR